MLVNDNDGGLTPRGALVYFASKLAPAGIADSMKRVVRRRQRGSNCGLRRRSVLAPFDFFLFSCRQATHTRCRALAS